MRACARVRPRTWGGICGMLLASALYIFHALSLRAGGSGLPVYWLGAFLIPGALAGHLAWRSGIPGSTEREAALAGLLVAHFAALLQLCVLALGVLSIDWAAYAQLAGPQTAGAVREAVLPATLVAATLTVAITYIGCVAAGWLGGLGYVAVRRRTTGA